MAAAEAAKAELAAAEEVAAEAAKAELAAEEVAAAEAAKEEKQAATAAAAAEVMEEKDAVLGFEMAPTVVWLGLVAGTAVGSTAMAEAAEVATRERGMQMAASRTLAVATAAGEEAEEGKIHEADVGGAGRTDLGTGLEPKVPKVSEQAGSIF